MTVLSPAPRKRRRTQTKTLSGRKADKPTYPKGKILRASSLVMDRLRRKLRHGESYDKLFRRMLGLPQRDGTHEELFECYVLPSTGEHFPTRAKAKARGVAHGLAEGKTEKFEQPLKMREIV